MHVSPYRIRTELGKKKLSNMLPLNAGKMYRRPCVYLTLVTLSQLYKGECKVLWVTVTAANSLVTSSFAKAFETL